jgi:hypothetical protein
MTWTEPAVDRVKELYLSPEKFTLPVIAARMTAEFRTVFSLRMIQAKIHRLGIKNRNDRLIWASPRDTRLAELYSRSDAPSYSVMRDAINREFDTTFSRCAIASKIDQMNLRGRDLPTGRSLAAYTPRPSKPRAVKVPAVKVKRVSLLLPPPAIEAVKLRCAEIVPLNLTFAEMGENHCWYPFGEGEPSEFVFCGHPRFSYSRNDTLVKTSYCGGHFDLTRGAGTVGERRASFTIGRVA